MSDYILFDLLLCQRFVELVADRGFKCEVRPDPIEGFVVTVPDDLPDDLEQDIEHLYEALMADQLTLIESMGDNSARTLMRVTATLADSSQRIVQLPVAYARRLFEHFTVEEIHGLVSAIVQSAMNPVEEPICRKVSGSRAHPETGACATADGEQ